MPFKILRSGMPNREFCVIFYFHKLFDPTQQTALIVDLVSILLIFWAIVTMAP